MISIPYEFEKADESYITVYALRCFIKEIKSDEFKTTLNRPELLEEVKKYAGQSDEKEEVVYNWLDNVLAEGIKEIQIRYIDQNTLHSNINFEDTFLEKKLDTLLLNKKHRHLCDQYTSEIALFKYEIINDNLGKCVKLYMGKLLYVVDKKNESRKCPYPIYVEIYLDKGIIIVRAKPKSGLYKYSEEFELESAISTTAENQMKEVIAFICENLNIQILDGMESNNKFRNNLYQMLDKYTQTPKEILELIEKQENQIISYVDSYMKMCNLPDSYRSDVTADVCNMVEKYLSINYPDKSIFTKDRDAYPLKLIATDEELSKVEQTAALEYPLQSKAVFFDNKKMLQKSQLCDGVIYMFNRKNSIYSTKSFKVKVVVKREICTLKFTEYTLEEDINNVLFSFINA